ncbi:hypothetical protein PA7_48410 [Pseudonocardia asaccharolytica DSM 44247 = NBRC 16224]|uniref:Uncharacterized protein n=1 Tax=Pseudonocardia asaccharolytica DSM 44247 = NBRC 16224 TaxID=1123024 RepID=A0A511DBH3_9PSEU|nr:hypothetical protein PA7_48410 [Pseudonocardia asaccharolytica DSM 44247 = NBRC 16224]
MNPLEEFMVQNPGLADALIGQHTDEGRGYCQTCALGAQHGYRRYPCDIRRMAEHAREIERDHAKR